MPKLVFVALCLLFGYVNVEGNAIRQCKLANGQLINVGDQQPEVGTCNIVTCHDEGSISSLTCPAFRVMPPCKIVAGDKTKLYPSCCPKSVCP